MSNISEKKENLLENIKFVEEVLHKYGVDTLTGEEAERFADSVVNRVKEELKHGDNTKAEN
jgi:hypothetical protein